MRPFFGQITSDEIRRPFFGQRTAHERARLALRLKPMIAEKAEQRMLNPMQNSAQGTTRDELAKVAGVSHDTIAKVEARSLRKNFRKLKRQKQEMFSALWFSCFITQNCTKYIFCLLFSP